MSVKTTYPKMLGTFKKAFGGSIRRFVDDNPKHKQAYEWACSGSKARRFCRILGPYLIEKWRQAGVALEASRHPKGSPARDACIAFLRREKRIEYDLSMDYLHPEHPHHGEA